MESMENKEGKHWLLEVGKMDKWDFKDEIGKFATQGYCCLNLTQRSENGCVALFGRFSEEAWTLLRNLINLLYLLSNTFIVVFCFMCVFVCLFQIKAVVLWFSSALCASLVLLVQSARANSLKQTSQTNSISFLVPPPSAPSPSCWPIFLQTPSLPLSFC